MEETPCVICITTISIWHMLHITHVLLDYLDPFIWPTPQYVNPELDAAYLGVHPDPNMIDLTT